MGGKSSKQQKMKKNYETNLLSEQEDLAFISEEAENYNLVFPLAEQKRVWTWSFAFYLPAALAS